MDPVTHVISGALVSRVAKEKEGASRLLWLCLASSVAPDVDFIVGTLGPEASLLHHRGITHSIAGGVFIALFMTWIFWVWRRPFRFWVGFRFSYLIILLHIFLDLATSYGTQVLAPFSNHRFTLNSVFIIDPIMTLTALALLALSIVLKKRAKRLALAGLAFLLVYPVFNFAVNQTMRWRLADQLHRQGVQFQRLDLIPEPLTPIFWKAVITNSSEYGVSSVNIFESGKRLGFTHYTRASTSLVRKAVEGSSMFRTYMWFAAYPVIETKTTSSGTAIVLTDLRFLTNIFGNRRGIPFTLTGHFNNNQRLTYWEYQSPSGEMITRILQ